MLRVFITIGENEPSTSNLDAQIMPTSGATNTPGEENVFVTSAIKIAVQDFNKLFENWKSQTRQIKVGENYND